MPVKVIISIFLEPGSMDSVANTLKKLPEVKDLYEVTGEYDLVAFLEVESVEVFREILKKHFLNLKGIKGTVSSVILYTHKKDGVLV